MNISGMDLNLLVVLDAIHRTRSLTRAGTEVGLSQPAVSHALSRLRLYFHDPLFTRTSHGMTPTPRALALARPVRSVLQTVHDCLNAAGTEEPPDLAFTRSLSGDMSFFLERLSKLVPGVHFPVCCIPTDQVLASVRNEKARVGLVLADGLLPSRTKGLAHKVVLSQPTMLVLSSHHPLARRRRVRLKELVQEQFIWFSPKLSPQLYRDIDDCCRASGFRFKIHHQVMDQESLLSYLQAGSGVALFPTCQRNLSTIGICLRPLKERLPAWKFSMVWRKDDHSPLVARTLKAIETIGAELTRYYARQPT